MRGPALSILGVRPLIPGPFPCGGKGVLVSACSGSTAALSKSDSGRGAKRTIGAASYGGRSAASSLALVASSRRVASKPALNS